MQVSISWLLNAYLKLDIKNSRKSPTYPSCTPILPFMLHDVILSVGLTLHKIKHYGCYVSEGLCIHFVHEKIQSVRVRQKATANARVLGATFVGQDLKQHVQN